MGLCARTLQFMRGVLRVVQWLIYTMVYLGSALMLYNIYCFVRFMRYVHQIRTWGSDDRLLILPVVLLVLFLMGYLFIGIVGRPDIVVAGILFSGSVFVQVMYRLLSGITHRIVQSERMEAELIAAERSNRARTAFLATVSHEMRTPMNIILGLDDIALKDPDLSPKARCQLEQIGKSGRHLLGLINDVLDLNRVETGTLRLDSRPFSLEDVLAQVNAGAEALCIERGLTFEGHAEDGLPRWALGDGHQLQRALMCLIDNAVKFTEPPGAVTFRAGMSDGNVFFVVSDTGQGMDPAFAPRCFELFAQEDDSSTSRHGGSGLGLAIVKSIVDGMGGRIEVESLKGAGSTFTVTAPLKAAQPPEAEELPGLEGRRVLIADDMIENAEIVADLLELEGAESEHAVNGRRALELFGGSPEGHFDAILMDLRMPEMDGLTAARHIRRLDRPDAKRVPIIALSANDAEDDIQQTLDAGMNAHLSKPVDADRLYETLRHALAGRANA